MRNAVTLALSFLSGAACSAVALSLYSSGEPYRLPEAVLEQAGSPSGTRSALLLRAPQSNGFDLGADDRFYLALRRGESTCILTRELSEGFGSYEGGVGALRWTGDDTVFIERWVSDAEANLAFDTERWTWSDTP